MDKFINDIQISNFKSIRNCEINNCNRINLFIGRPNVGKSNIIEALSLFTTPCLRENFSPNAKLSSLIRIENESELFYNGNTETKAFINTNKASCTVNYNPKDGLVLYFNVVNDLPFSTTFDSKLSITKSSFVFGTLLEIKRYNFNPNINYKKGHAKYLIPPFGFNLLSIIEQYPQLKEDVFDLFKEFGAEIAFDKSSQTLKIIQRTKDGEIFLIPYNSIADTLQRIIFYKAAIASNDDSILLFEEPEAHSFPPYMTHLTQEIIRKKDNQFFIATHSPFILNDLIENGREELAVFIVYYEDNETKVKQLSPQELHDVSQFGVDLFTNSESFI
jgi:AAA15 family ATPase/GTPase